MEMITYRDQAGTEWKEIIHDNKMRLIELRNEYEKKGAQSWISAYGADKWMLLIQEKMKS